MFCKKGVLRNFKKFTGKHLCQSLFFNKVAGLRPSTLLNKRLWHRCFPMNFVKSLRTPFYKENVVNGGLETICYRASLLWTNLPLEYKLQNSLNIFKRKIKNWKGENCPCRLCKTYVRELGHI